MSEVQGNYDQDAGNQSTGNTMIKKIIKIQKELKAPKDQYNKFANFKFRSCEDILEAVKPLLYVEGLMQTISDELVCVGERYYIKATVTVTDGTASKIVTGYAREPQQKKGMDESQITGTASSYARKYALNGIWAIDDTKDADTGEHTKTVQQPPTRPLFTPKNKKWDTAIENIHRGEGSINGIKKHYILSKAHEELMKKELITLNETEEND